MKNSLLYAMLLGVTVLSGCTTIPCCTVQPMANNPAAANTPPAPAAVAGPCGTTACAVEPVARRLMATGYGNSGSYNQYTTGQAKLMAMRAAKIDAYRNLAEQVHGVRVWGNTAVSSFVAQSDVVRTYVDSFIRGARVVSVSAIADSNYEATVELELTASFFDCFASPGRCASSSAASGIAPSATYTSY